MRKACTNLAAMFALLLAAAPAFAQPPKTTVKLRSSYFSPGLTLAESKHPVHEVAIEVQVDAKGEGQGKLILLPTKANYDEYGDFVTGREADNVNRNRTSDILPNVELECAIEFVKAGFIRRVNEAGIKRSIFRVKGPKISSPLFVATTGPGLTSGRWSRRACRRSIPFRTIASIFNIITPRPIPWTRSCRRNWRRMRRWPR